MNKITDAITRTCRPALVSPASRRPHRGRELFRRIDAAGEHGDTFARGFETSPSPSSGGKQALVFRGGGRGGRRLPAASFAWRPRSGDHAVQPVLQLLLRHLLLPGRRSQLVFHLLLLVFLLRLLHVLARWKVRERAVTRGKVVKIKKNKKIYQNFLVQ